MSLEAMKWVLHKAYVEDHGDFRVLIALAERAHTDGTCAWPSIKWLAERMQRSERTVQRSLARLQKAGVIRPGDQSNIPPGIPANRRPVVYDLAMSGVTASDTPKVEVGVTPDALGVTPHVAVGVTPGVVQTVLSSLREETKGEPREEPQPKPKRPARPRAVPLPENWDPDIKSYAERSGLPESLVENELAMFRVKRKSSIDWDADALAWLLRKKGWLIEAANRAPNVANLHGQVALFSGAAAGETAEEKAARVAAEVEARNKRVAEQFARRDESERWHAARAQEPQVSAQESQADQEPDHDVNDPAAVRAHLIAAGFTFEEGGDGMTRQLALLWFGWMHSSLRALRFWSLSRPRSIGPRSRGCVRSRIPLRMRPAGSCLRTVCCTCTRRRKTPPIL